MLVLESSLLPEFLIRLAVMISFVIAFGGVGILFLASVFESTKPLRLVESFGLAMVAGPALIILLVSALTLVKVPLTRLNLSVVLLIGCGVSILRFSINKPEIRIRATSFLYHDLTENILPLSLFFALIVLRLVQIRDLFVPNGYDGLLHTTLLQESAEKSAISVYSIFQIGFPAISFVVHSLWQLSPAETILLTSQWLSAVGGLSFFLFARRYIHNVYAAGLSFVIYAFLLFFPSALASWEQYSFLLGLALLPMAILTGTDWVNRKRSVWSALLLVFALALTHHGLVLIWSAFFLVYVMNQIVLRKPIRPKTLHDSKEAFLRPLLWILPVAMVTLSRALHPLRPDLLQSNNFSPWPETDLGFGVLYLLRLFRTHDSIFILLGLGWIVWSLVWKRKFLYLTLFWPLAIWFLIWLQYEVLRSSILTYANLVIFLCLPLAIGIGLLVRQFYKWLVQMDAPDDRPRFRHQAKSRLSILLMIGILAGISQSPLDMDQRRVLFTDEDGLAMQWIRASTPEDSGFLIRNTTLGNNPLAPSDGGGWIPLLTGRRTVIPQTGELYDICEFAAEHDVNYMYFGEQTGDERFDLRLSDLDEATYEVVYGSQTVEIAAVRCR